MRWRYARRDLSRWATVAPSNMDDLAAEDRVLELLAQARLEPTGGARTRRDPFGTSQSHRNLVATGIEPRGDPLRVRVLVRTDAPERGPTGDDAFSRMLREPSGDLVATVGAQGPVTLRYRVDAGAMGAQVDVMVDGRIVRRDHVVTRTQSAPLSLAQGTHELRLAGAGLSAMAFVNAPPAHHGQPIVQRWMAELTEVPLEYRLGEGVRGETAILQIATLDPRTTYAVRSIVFAGAEPIATTHRVVGIATAMRPVWLWDEGLRRAGYAEARIPLGPSATGFRTLRLSHTGGTATRLWVRLVVFTTEPSEPSEHLRLWRHRATRTP